MQSELRIGFIGGGNMASAMIGGLLAKGTPPTHLSVSDPYAPRVEELRGLFPIHVTDNNDQVLQHHPHLDILILAVKPQVMKQVCQGLARSVHDKKPCIVSIAAGITIDSMKTWLSYEGKEYPFIVRCMPNTPALVNEGATGMYASQGVNQEQKKAAEAVLSAISKRLYWVEREDLLDVVTGVSGSGPAYFFLLIECLEQAGVKLGLPLDVARGLAAQTCLGAGRMAMESDVDAAELRRRVTSPNGTTHAAITCAEELGVRNLWFKAVEAATRRGEELGRELGKL